MNRVFICLALTLCMNTPLTARENPEKKNLVLYSSFDFGVNPDLSKDGAGLKAAQGKFKFVTGKYGKAVHFGDGNAAPYNLVYSVGRALYGDEWTIAAWIKLDTSAGMRGTVFRSFTSGEWKDGDIFAVFDKWNKLNFNLFDARGKSCGSTVSARMFPAQKWIHIAFTLKDGKTGIYVNGTEVNYIKQTNIFDPGRTQNFLRIGNSSANSRAFLRGSIDELKIYNVALMGEELHMAMAPGSENRNALPTPVLFLPLEGSVEPASGVQNISANSSKINFTKGIVGQGVVLMRHGYDSKSSLTFKGVPGLFGKAMSISLFFIPYWDGTHEGEHGLLAARGGDASWELKVKNTLLGFGMLIGGKRFYVDIPVRNWKKNQPVFITAGYSIAEKKMFLSTNAAIAKQICLPANLGFASTCGKDALLVVGDTLATSRYMKTQANGIMDEIRIFNAYLTAKECRAEFARKDNATRTATDRGWTLIEKALSPEERKLWDLNGAWKSSTTTRDRICLNALWRFQLADSPRQSPNPQEWHYLAVPGRYSGEGNGRSDHQFLIRDKYLKPINADGMSQRWKGKPASHYRCAWFERTFAANKTWKNKVVTLCLEELGVTENGVVFLNGTQIAKLADKKQYKIEIMPNLLRYQQENVLTVQTYDHGNCWAWRGIKGDVFLDISGKVLIGSPTVITSVTKKEIIVNMKVANKSASCVKVTPVCVLRGESSPGEIIGSQVTLKPGESTSVSLSKKWRNPHLWDYVDPYLYQCKLFLRDISGGIMDEYPVFKIGFREFTIHGGDYFLNTKKIHLRNYDAWLNSTIDYAWCRNFVKLLKDTGFNSLRLPFNDKDVYMKNIYRACDEEGLLLFANAVGAHSGDFALWKNPATRKRVLSNMKSIVDSARNNPSVVLWYLSVNQLGYGWDYHPLKMTDGYLPEYRKEKAAVCQEVGDILRKYDPTREFFFQAGGAFGPIINSNAYFNWWPEAEKLAWAQEWSMRKPKPLHIIETSFPYWQGLLGMDLRYPQAKPFFMLENAARYYGQDAYEKQNDEWLHLMADPAGKSNSSLKWNIITNLRKDYRLYYKLKGDMLTPTIQAWRGADISGVCPFAEFVYAYFRTSPYASIHTPLKRRVTVTDFRIPGWHPDILKVAAHMDINPQKPTSYLKSLKAALSPILVYIGGERNNPTSKSHSYFEGDTVEKTIVMINDNRHDEKFELRWRLMNDDKVLKNSLFEAILAPGQIIRLPVTVTMPKTNKPMLLQLRVNVVSPSNTIVKPFEITVFPRMSGIRPKTKIALYDSTGQTGKAMKELGITYDDVRKLMDLDGYGLLIIGRESLDGNFQSHASRLGLGEKIYQGLVNVVVLEQLPQALNLLGLKAQPIYARRVFTTGINSSLLHGLCEKDLQWWNGCGTLAPQHEPPASSTEESVSSPLWHWSNLNLVSSFPVRRPTSGAYKLHLVTGMDLVYTPLLEMTVGAGRILFCQMETIGRTRDDPAALTLLANIVREFSGKTASIKYRKLYYLQNVLWGGFLSELGLKATPIKSINEFLAPGILLITRKLTKQEQTDVHNLAKNGSDILFAPLSEVQARSFAISLKTIMLHRYEINTDGSRLLGGLSRRDRFFRYGQNISELSGKNLVPLVAPAFTGKRKIGKGAYIFVQLNPFAMQDAIKRDRKIGNDTSNLWADSIVKERLLSFWGTLFKNLGCEYESIAGRFAKMDIRGEEQELSGKWNFCPDPKNIGQKENWNMPAIAAKLNRIELKVPGYWEGQGVRQLNPYYRSPSKKPGGYDGYAWYFTKVKIKSGLRGKKLILRIGAIDDNDWTYINGKQIGYTDTKTPGYWAAPRNYTIPASITQDGILDIAIRVFDIRGNGGIKGFVKLVEKIDRSDISALPYYAKKMPSYNTESHNRW